MRECLCIHSVQTKMLLLRLRYSKLKLKEKKTTESSSEHGRLIPVWLLRDEGYSQDPIVMTFKLHMSQVCMLGGNFPDNYGHAEL